MSDEEIKQKVLLYFGYKNEKQYNAAFDYMKKVMNSSDETKSCILNYLDFQKEIMEYVSVETNKS